jgi:hypothetical protein
MHYTTTSTPFIPAHAATNTPAVLASLLLLLPIGCLA